MFRNCASPQKIEYINQIEKLPKIIFPSKILAIMRHIVDSVPQEVGWLGYVEKVDNNITVTDIYIPGQHVHGCTCELDEGESLTNVCLQIEAEGKDPSNVKLWGHSHGSGGTSPSDQDRVQALSLMKDLGDYLIRVICCKGGDMSVSYFDAKQGIIVENIQWYISDGIDRKAIAEKYDPIIKENVKQFNYNSNVPSSVGHADYNDDGWNQDIIDKHNKSTLKDDFKRRANKTKFSLAGH